MGPVSGLPDSWLLSFHFSFFIFLNLRSSAYIRVIPDNANLSKSKMWEFADRGRLRAIMYLLDPCQSTFSVSSPIDNIQPNQRFGNLVIGAGRVLFFANGQLPTADWLFFICGYLVVSASSPITQIHPNRRFGNLQIGAGCVQLCTFLIRVNPLFPCSSVCYSFIPVPTGSRGAPR